MKRKSIQQKMREQRLKNKTYYRVNKNRIKARRLQKKSKIVLEIVGVSNMPIDYNQIAAILSKGKIVHPK